MKTIGLVGGIASGKSTVAAELAALGAVVLDADKAAHEAIDFPEIRQTLVERWGEEIIDATGRIDRNAVARRVFSQTGEQDSELEFLEKVLHPVLRRQFEAELELLRIEGTAVAVIDAPLLLEAGWRSLCDRVVFVDAPATVRENRGIERKWSAADFARREAAQMPIEQKKRQATDHIPNHGSRDDLRRNVRAFWETLGGEAT